MAMDVDDGGGGGEGTAESRLPLLYADTIESRDRGRDRGQGSWGSEPVSIWCRYDFPNPAAAKEGEGPPSLSRRPILLVIAIANVAAAVVGVVDLTEVAAEDEAGMKVEPDSEPDLDPGLDTDPEMDPAK
ncbi:hypothetical protein BGX24_006548 [Mortierella sp. AD032]|nr:hypothetical protein BGX24_006548 [Mortierella sp. AD032]